jgi:hypothetical protein
LTTYGFHAGEKNPERRKQIRAFCKKKALGSPVFASADYMHSIAVIHRSREKCILVGSIDDIIPPEPYKDSPVYEWREVFFNYIEEHGISFHPIDVDTYSVSDSSARNSMTAIRSFRRSCKSFEQHIRLLDRSELGAPYAFGRPPYGYDIVEGKLVINKEQAKAIKEIFKLNEKGNDVPSIIAVLRKNHGVMRVGTADKKHAWDYTKVKRILSKSQLYCEGIYTGGNMTLQIPDIIIHTPSSSKETA